MPPTARAAFCWETYEHKRRLAKESGTWVQDKQKRVLELATLASTEQDPDKFMALIKEINEILDPTQDREDPLPPSSTSD
jgi:hypothetical protein